MGSLCFVDLLLQRGADVNAKDDMGDSALHFAVRATWNEVEDFQEVICRLLECPDLIVDVTNNAGKTPIDCARQGGYNMFGEPVSQRVHSTLLGMLLGARVPKRTIDENASETKEIPTEHGPKRSKACSDQSI